jgi:DNA-binding NarL/FixJ family response regulator
MTKDTPQQPEPADGTAVKIATLNTREREIITLVGQGLKNQAIAGRLSLTDATVRDHLSAIFAKLEVADRLELVVYAYYYGLAHFSG